MVAAVVGSSSSASAIETPYTVKYKDSTATAEGSMVAYNRLEINNSSATPLHLNGEVIVPAGWKSLFDTRLNITVAAGTSESVNLNLICSKTTLAKWQQVKLRLWGSDSLKAKTYTYMVNTLSKPSFIAEKLTDDLYFDENPKEIK